MSFKKLILASIAVSLLVVTFVTFYVRHQATDDLATKAAAVIGVYKENLLGEISKYEVIPQLLATKTQYLNLLNDPENAILIDATNRLLEQEFKITEVLDIFLLNETGRVIASSNWNQVTSYIGEELAFRPYFTDAMNTGTGRYFALGTTSGKRGYYFSRSIEKNGTFMGALVVKVDLARLEAAWASGPELVTVTDQDNVFFISSDPDWLYRFIDNPSQEDWLRIKSSQRFASKTPTLLPFVKIDTRESGNDVFHVYCNGETFAPDRYLMQSMPLSEEGWMIQIWSDLKIADAAVKRAQMLSILFCLSLASLAALFYFIWRARQTKLKFAAQSHQMLQNAYGELETRVQQRTEQLSETNARLHNEIAERKQAESELQLAQKNLIQVEKMAALGQMATSITHELNQPLGAVRTFSDTARTYIQRGQLTDAEENLALIARMADRMSGITSHLKTFARKTPVELDRVNLSSVLQETLLMLDGPLSKAGISVIQSTEIEDAHVHAEYGRLQQVLTNLLQNAMDVLKDRNEKILTIKTVRQHDDVVISVRDSGPGLDESVLGRIFEPFYTTKTSEGLGLGLAISEGIVNDFGGTLEARNCTPYGAEFLITLPLSPVLSEAVA